MSAGLVLRMDINFVAQLPQIPLRLGTMPRHAAAAGHRVVDQLDAQAESLTASGPLAIQPPGRRRYACASLALCSGYQCNVKCSRRATAM
jgi:hypothetical protein